MLCAIINNFERTINPEAKMKDAAKNEGDDVVKYLENNYPCRGQCDQTKETIT